MNTPPLVTIQAQRDHLAHCQARLDRLRAESIYYPASTLHTAEQTVRRESKYLRELERKQAQQLNAQIFPCPPWCLDCGEHKPVCQCEVFNMTLGCSNTCGPYARYPKDTTR